MSMNHDSPPQKIILIVDDEENILRSLERIFEEEGYEVHKATNGLDGLEILENHPVQVVISDQRMPGMNGSEFLTRVNSQFPQTVRILLSAYSDFEATRAAINSGAIYKFLSKPWNVDSLLADVDSAFKIYFERNEKEQVLFNSIYNDKLTGLPNRVFFNQKVASLITESHISKQNFAVIVVDIDHFSSFNDREGDEMGDQLLRVMTSRLKEWVKSTGNLARLRSDQFILLVTDIELSKLDQTLSSLMKELQVPFEIEDKKFTLITSVGVSLYPKNGEQSDLLINRAKRALLFSKKMGGNVYKIYSPEQENEMAEVTSESELHQALENKQFVMYYQPIIEIKTGKIVSAEALVRWQHPIYDFIVPDKFILLCEETGFIIRLGEWILRTSCEQLHRWNLAGYSHLGLAINLSVLQFNHSGLFEMLENILKKTKVPPERLELEITESAMMYNVDENNLLLDSMKNLGIRLSLDDFGTGYSSFSYLKSFSIDTIKIDQSFIHDLSSKNKSGEIVSSIIGLAKILDLDTIAEGVENEEQLKFLKDQGCDYYQGYFFSKPVSSEEFYKLLNSSS